MLINFIIILLICGVVVYVGNRYFNSLDQVENEFEEDENEIDIAFLKTETLNFFALKDREKYDDLNLTREELKKKNRQKAQFRDDLRKAKYGDYDAIRSIKNTIRDFLLGQPKYDLENNIDSILPVTKPKKLKRVNDKFEICLYLYNQKFGEDGFDKMAEEFDIRRPYKDEHGEVRYVFTREMMDNAYKYVLSGKSSLGKINFSFNDKLEILTQKIFEQTYGFGPISMLRETGIDEIEGGVSGVPVGNIQRKVLKNNNVRLKNLPYSFEAVWIVYKGLGIKLECLSFETQDELERVCNNIYKYKATHVLSSEQAYILNTMIDGARLLVCRPPFADSYCFFLRKFDSAPGFHPRDIVKEQKAVLPICLLRWFLKGRRNLVVTGDQGTGKSTFLKGIIRYIETTYNIRLQEMQFELNLRLAYPNRNITTFQETAAISAQEGLNIQKKSSGAVNIIGEAATAIQMAFVAQTAKVASLFALWTHHGKTAVDTVNASADNLIQIGMYKDKKDAVRAMANIINVDCHLVNVRGHRYIERITEIIPTENRPYPSKKKLEEMGGMDIKGALELEHLANEYVEKNPNWRDLTYMDASSYFERVTDPEVFTVKDIIRWESTTEDDSEGTFVLVNMPSDEMIEDMKLKFTTKEIAEFERDLHMIKAISNGETPDGVEEWVAQQMNY